MKKIRVISLLALLFVIPIGAYAAQFSGGQNVLIAKDETVQKNVYTAGGTVSVSGDMQSDVISFGGNVTIDGHVHRDVIAGAGTLSIPGTIDSNLRAAGGTINITGSIGGDVILAGGQVNSSSGARLTGDTLAIYGGDIVLDGIATSTVHLYAKTIEIRGTINGDLDVHAEQLLLTNTAFINGNLEYASPNQITIQGGAKISGQTKYTKVEQKKASAFPFTRQGWILRVIMAFIAAFAVSFLFKKHNEAYVQNVFAKFGIEAVRGFVVLVVTPIAVIVLMATVIGIPLAFIALLTYILTIIVAAIYTNILAGSLIYKWVTRDTNYRTTWQIIIVGVVVLNVFRMIPILGWVITFVLFLASFGSCTNILYTYFFKHPEKN